mgnify:CR=1 FL=1
MNRESKKNHLKYEKILIKFSTMHPLIIKDSFMNKFFTILICFVVAISVSESKPQYSVLQTYGVRCINCHVNVQGGGVRNTPGWMSRKDIALINPSSIGLQDFFDFIGNSNTAIDDKVLFGMDTRVQSAKWGSPSASQRDLMLMQMSPYLVITPFDFLQIEAFYNLAYDLESNKRYIGQQQYAASLYIKPSEDLPQLRIGFFQPTIGTKYEDHTLLIRRVADQGKSLPLIPDDYAELGAQIDYGALSWLEASVGIFTSENFSKLSITDYTGVKKPITSDKTLSYVTRLVFTPELPFGLTGYFGFSGLANGNFSTDDGFYLKSNYLTIASLFLNIGFTDNVSLMFEYLTAKKHNSFTSKSYMLEVNYQLLESVIPYVRIEQGSTEQRLFEDYYTYNVNQYVIGAHIYLLPYIELLPEYRIYDREKAPGHQAQWAFQLHLFY